ncbi:MFS transporter [Stigmatella erecta]|uniref:MFS transporter, MHS family, proline/betaine transporter n=1 Tax=Stigmatella erecta TaxID=83460 RepID=A0A1I0DHB8_9BACT|nr:MFS transporter [Stigmatella erecta]SET31760.1 MFS transporter, MHS family, proline/betaine transporter [Stigmatella erecta]
MPESQVRALEVDERTSRRAVIAACSGNVFEWYDFTVYALFALSIAKAFFPSSDPTIELVKAFLAFGLGFVVRPLGAVLLGIYGDRAGRKAVLTATIGLMAVGTLIIAVSPTYAAIGVGAPLLLLAGRVLQGFSAGGEVGGAAALLIEHAPSHRRGEYASWLQASMAASNILGALVAFGVTSLLTREQLDGFGWRIPFVIGLLIAPIGMWIRNTLDETPEFKREAGHRGSAPVRPLRTLLSEFPLMVLKGSSLSILWTVSSYVLVIFMPTYVQRSFGYTPSEAFTASLVGNVVMVAICVLAGIASDRLGRKTVLMAAALWLVVLVHPMLWLVQTQHGLATLIAAQTLLCIGVGCFVGVAPSTLAELFPARVRSTGVSVCYNLAVTLFSGFAPAVLAWLTGRGGVFAPGWYVIIAAVLAAPALVSLKPGRAPGASLSQGVSPSQG